MENQNQFKFFIVDDDTFCASMYQHDLKNMGYNDITYFSNGTDCLSNLNQNPDIIFLDHNMEDITGFEVLKKIKRYNPNIYVVMVSGQETIKTAVDALKYGAFDYIVKDNKVSDKMVLIIDKIILVKQELRKSNPNFIQRLLFFF
ncbi:response regulator [Flavobacterium nackdongense]|uniref:Response regulator n=1 Tax=Flavobacterium nackdongense TaxID=2547394 RepID=A0A4P6Y5R8_9FLAO|nr:response regulator [Flavobacterium nackdongense]QBN17519.1 response regulator [Flavobacterium nackdongense]